MGAPDRRLELSLVGGEVLDHLGPLAELDDLRLVGGVQRLHEADGGRLGLAQLRVHRRRGVDQYRQGDGEVFTGEDREGLAHSLLQYLEVALPQVGDEPALGIGDRHRQVDDVHAGLEDRQSSRRRNRSLRPREARPEQGEQGGHGNEPRAHPSPRRLGRNRRQGGRASAQSVSRAARSCAPEFGGATHDGRSCKPLASVSAPVRRHTRAEFEPSQNSMGGSTKQDVIGVS